MLKLSTSVKQEPCQAFRMCWWSGNLEKKEKKKRKKEREEEKKEREEREGKDSNFKYFCPNLVSNRLDDHNHNDDTHRTLTSILC